MHGSPLLRSVVLTVALAVMGMLISTVAGPQDPLGQTPAPLPAPPPATPAADLPAMLSIQLSAPARELTLTSADGATVFLAATNPELDMDYPLNLPIREASFTGLLTVRWQAPGPNRFLRLVLEPELRTTRELLLHAPDDLEQHAIEFHWPGE